VKLSKEEKLKLYDAIGYTEGEDSLLKYPENVILIFFLTLQQLFKFQKILILYSIYLVC
jgi:hypothetical protein